MIEALRKIILFSGSERKEIYKSIFVSFLRACFSTIRIGAIYFIIKGLINDRTDTEPAWMAFTLMLVSILGTATTRYISLLMQTHAGFFMSANKRLDIADKLKRVPMGFFNKNSTGEITGITTTVMDTVENLGATVLVLVLGGLINTLVFFSMIPFLDKRIAVVVFAGIVVYMIFTSIMEHGTRTMAPRREKGKAKIVSEVLENLQGMSVVKSFNLAGKGDIRLRKAIDEYRDSNMNLEKVFIPTTIIQNIVLGGFKMAIIFLSAYFYLQGSMELITALMLSVIAYQVFAEIEQTDSGLSMLRVVTASLNQVGKVDDIPKLDIDGEDFTPRNQDIAVRNICFSYDSKEILHDVSLDIPTNTMTAFVGPSGAGKSTLALLLSRFWDVNSGSISIGGKNIKEYTLDALMSQMSIVFQNVYLFEDTVENNIRFGCPKASREDVIKAAKMACCHEFIESLPYGYDTVVGEGGATLSGGEKQRVSIARAILKDAPIIILDEATANVDPENEDKLKAAFEALTRNKTVIMIAHRLETIKNADQIVVINNGSAETGTHEQLLRDNPVYGRFIHMREEAAGWSV